MEPHKITVHERVSMKHRVISAFILICIFCTALPAQAFQDFGISATDSKILALGIMSLIDYEQSTTMFFNRRGFSETNPLLGAKPGRENLAAFGLVGLTLVWGGSKLLSEGKFKNFVIDSIIATEKLNIEENREIMRYRNPKYNRMMLVLSFDF